jgi:signal transduction histidine kinase
MKAPVDQLMEQPNSWRTWSRTLLLTALIANTIATLVVLIDPYDSVIGAIAMANASGFAIWSIVFLVRSLSRGHIGRVTAVVIAGPAGTLVGFEVGSLLGISNPLARWLGDPWHQWRPIATALLLTFAAMAFVLRHRAAIEYRAGLETHHRHVAEARQAEALARLALLQAQIEPHFLFNTLANVRSMLERDPRTAGQMLDLLNRYLRSSLGRTRTPRSTCGEEIELIDALLGIAAIRLGSRLRYEIRLPAGLRAARLPPLLLQPLVENALKHGIEPAVEGGMVEVECMEDSGRLVLRVRDTGMGFHEGAPPGVGLSNIRARLASLYGANGQLALYRNEPRGTVAELTLPLTRE